VATRTRDIAGFAHSSFVHGCRRHDVYRAGSGPAALGLDDADLTRVRERTRDGVDVLGLRFTADKGCPRFQILRRELGPRFEGIEIDSSPGNPHGIPGRAHAVLTVDLVDEPGHPTRAALERVMAFLAERLEADRP
jgi:hypothetical protein